MESSHPDPDDSWLLHRFQRTVVHLWVSWPWDCPTLAPVKAMENSTQEVNAFYVTCV